MFFEKHFIVSDRVLEEELPLLLSEAQSTGNLDIAFRNVRQVTPSVAVRLLLLFLDLLKGTTEQSNPPVCRLYISMPDAVDDRYRASYLSCMRFLSQLRFFEHAELLGVQLFGVEGWGYQMGECITFRKVEWIVNTHKDTPDERQGIYGCCIPIHSISSLEDIESIRAKTFGDLESLFGEMVNEPIVAKGGLADCLLLELLKNVVDHVENGRGFFCVATVKGLRSMRQVSPGDYRTVKDARIKRETPDWRLFFERYPEDAYFDVVVADNGPGICSTIRNALHIPQVAKTLASGKNIECKLMRAALLDTGSRFSDDERQRRGLASVTGYGAIAYLLAANGGALLFREPSGRYFFEISENKKWEGTGPISEFSYTPSAFKMKGNAANRTRRRQVKCIPLKHGLIVNCLIPFHTQESRGLWKRQIPLNSANFPHTTLHEIGWMHRVEVIAANVQQKTPWKPAIERVQAAADGELQALAVDIAGISLSKDILWPGLKELATLATEKRIALCLFGLQSRTANRIQDFCEMEATRRGRKNPELKFGLLVFGISDSGDCYLFTDIPERTGREREDKDKIVLAKRRIVLVAIEAFAKGVVPKDDAVLSTLKEHGYVTLGGGSTFVAGKLTWKVDGPFARIQQRNWIRGLVLDCVESPSSGVSYAREPVSLPTSEILTRYLDMGSLGASDLILRLLARLLADLLSCFDVATVFAVGKLTQLVLEKTIQMLNRFDAKVRYFHDYSQFDHGEVLVDHKEGKVLLLLDGCRTGQRATEAISYVEDTGAMLGGVVVLFSFSSGEGLPPLLSRHKCELAMAFPCETAPDNTNPTFRLLPFSNCLVPFSSKRSTEEQATASNVALETKRSLPESIAELERLGYIHEGHCTFGEQHFDRSIPLHYILSTEGSFFTEIVQHLQEIIDARHIECLIVPDGSSVGLLVRRLRRHKVVSCVYAKRCKSPGGGRSYHLDAANIELLATTDRILIVEDQCFTASSVVSILVECKAQLGIRCPPEVAVFAIIDSMSPSTREILVHMLSPHHARFVSFLHLPTCTYTDSHSCHDCSVITRYSRLAKVFRDDFLVAKQVDARLGKLSSTDIYGEHIAPKALTPLESTSGYLSYKGSLVRTQEGLLLSCEAAYVDGSFLWLLDRLFPAAPHFFRSEAVVFGVIGILSKDPDALQRVSLKIRFIEAVRMNIGHKHHFDAFNQLLEILTNWPPHWLREIWESLMSRFLLNVQLLTACYGALHLLFDRVMDIASVHCRQELLMQVENTISRGIEEDLLGEAGNVQSKKVHAQMLLNLRRSIHADGSPSSREEIAVAISDLFTVLAYGQKDHHQALRKSLMYLKNHSNPVGEIYRLDLTMELLSQLRGALESVSKQLREEIWMLQSIAEERASDGENFCKGFWEHSEYAVVIDTISRLCVRLLAGASSQRVPRVKSITNEELLADISLLHTRIYHDRSESSLRKQLETFRDQRCCSLLDVVSAVKSLWHKETIWEKRKSNSGNVDSSYCQGCKAGCQLGLEEMECLCGVYRKDRVQLHTFIPCSVENPNTWIGISAGELRLFIEELYRNLCHEVDYIEGLPPTKEKSSHVPVTNPDLFQVAAAKALSTVRVCIHVVKNLSSISIILRSDCSKENWDKLQNPTGFGLHAIAHALDRKGNRFISPDWRDGILTQTIQTWRIG